MDLNLKEVSGFTTQISDERGGVISTKYYKDYNIAYVKSKGSGFWGADAKVEPVKLWEDTDGNLYSVKLLGKFLDDKEGFHKEVLDSIMSKLSKEELALLGIVVN